MRTLPALFLLATVAGCYHAAADIKSTTPAPGHVLATFTLENEPFCESCTGRLHQELDGLPGISSVDARIGDHTLRVWHDPQTMPTDKILALLNEAGEKAKQP